MDGWEEKWRLELTSAKVEVEVESELGKNVTGSAGSAIFFLYCCFV